MTLGKTLDYLFKQLEYAKSQEWINKPLAWALYHTWKYVDEKEKER